MCVCYVHVMLLNYEGMLCNQCLLLHGVPFGYGLWQNPITRTSCGIGSGKECGPPQVAAIADLEVWVQKGVGT